MITETRSAERVAPGVRLGEGIRALGSRLVKRMHYAWRRILRVRATPHEIALGCAAGVFAACTPFFGFQMALAAALALILRVSIPAALAGTFIGNPLSWPAIWSASYVAGAYVLGLDPANACAAISDSVDAFGSLFPLSPQAFDAAVINLAAVAAPLVVGGLLVGFVLAAGSYYPTRRAVGVFQKRRAAL